MICIVITFSSIKPLCFKPLVLIKSDNIIENFAELIGFDVACPFLLHLYD